MATKTASKAQTLQGLLEGTKDLHHHTQRDDYGRTCNYYTLYLRNEEGKITATDYVVIVNLPKSWTETRDSKYLVNSKPQGYNPARENVTYHAVRTDAHLFAVETLLARH